MALRLQYEQLETTKKSTGVNQMLGIMCHHTAGGTYESNKGTLAGPIENYEPSTHFILGMNEGELAQVGSLKDILWHAGLGYAHILGRGSDQLDMNPYYIGIEVVSDSQGGGYTDWQRKTLPLLLKDIIDTAKEKYGKIIEPYNIDRHAQTSTKGKFDLSPEFYAPDVNPADTAAAHTAWREYIVEVFTDTEDEELVIVNQDMKQHIINSQKELLGAIWYLLPAQGKFMVEDYANYLRDLSS